MENIEIRGQTYVGMDTVSIPKADGSGDAEFVLPEGEEEIIENGEYDVTRKKTARVNVQASGTDDYNALSNKPAINGHTLQGDQTAAQLGLATPSDIPAVPTKTSELTNDSGFVDAAGAAAAAPVKSVNGETGAVVLSAADVGAGTYSKPAGGIPASDLAPGVIPAVPTKTSELSNDSGFVDAAGAAAAAPVQSVNGKTGAVVLGAADVGAGTYSKPSGGIPASDLASAVRTSLGKADTALQSVPSTYRTAAAQDAIDEGKIDKPNNPATGAFLVWTGSAWAAQTLATWQGGSY